jgi:hypothetical protein
LNKTLSKQASPEGARAVLLRAGYWSSEAEAAKAGEEGERDKSGRAFMQSSAEPWPQVRRGHKFITYKAITYMIHTGDLI